MYNPLVLKANTAAHVGGGLLSVAAGVAYNTLVMGVVVFCAFYAALFIAGRFFRFAFEPIVPKHGGSPRLRWTGNGKPIRPLVRLRKVLRGRSARRI